MTVREIAEIEIKGGKFPVFVIDVTTDKTNEIETTRNLRTLWYSEELGLVLKREVNMGGKSYVMRVLEIKSPENDNSENGRKKNLGTIII